MRSRHGVACRHCAGVVVKPEAVIIGGTSAVACRHNGVVFKPEAVIVGGTSAVECRHGAGVVVKPEAVIACRHSGGGGGGGELAELEVRGTVDVAVVGDGEVLARREAVIAEDARETVVVIDQVVGLDHQLVVEDRTSTATTLTTHEQPTSQNPTDTVAYPDSRMSGEAAPPLQKPWYKITPHPQFLCNFFTYIKERISYNSVCLILTCVKNFA